ncbi:heat shock protein 70 (hsp70)-interacting protein, putative [Schistosoma mansoni]|uniref:heat shock protein 70 (hsp70)-interacting protein, putative n=1 Tax=Schistosoma mansoni TaxID=6183 RepID=UPI0001A63DB1|nr:heat shock protein 70 (hsp70)-interacting protein, putative [Schistosoma mansoni]|eukprot:XP_018647226.1 heat shock protein 70 (hsp70)-interacting protein, putative [Schistosoma mansoni]
MLNIYRLINPSEDRKRLLQIKQNAILEHQEREMKRAKANKEMDVRGKKYALEQIMKLENVSREKIRLEKEQASRQAINEFVNAFNKSSQEENEMQNKIAEARRFSKQYMMKTIGEENNMELNKDIQQRLAFIEKPIDLPVRTSSTIEVKFTPRVFPTPERESTKQAEDEWLNKQAEYRRKLLDRVVPDDLSMNELDPIWLRKKGDSLFQAGDYEAAVIAYTEAITQNPKLHSAYSNRAACHLQLRNYFKALEDSSMALDLCVPPVAQNLKSRVRAHIRRGAAFCNLQLYKEGLIEYRAAQKLQPDDDTIRTDIENLEKFVNQE